jgi:cupin superfamily acireductone dioxygenase involved in methionine salvage
MSTRSNVILVTPNNKVHQFYHHWDGYLSGVGEELRTKLLYSVGISSIEKGISVYDVLIGEIMKDEDYEDEYVHDMNKVNHLHGDIEFLYVIKGPQLYYVNEWDLCEKLLTNQDIINYVCKDSNKIDVTKQLHDDE